MGRGRHLLLNGLPLTDLVVPERVRTIRSGVFQGAADIRSVSFSSFLTTIETRAFFGCSGIQSVVIPESVRSCGFEAFAECSSLEAAVVLPGKIETLDYVFRDCRNLSSLLVPDSVRTVSREDFADWAASEGRTASLTVWWPNGPEGTSSARYPCVPGKSYDFFILNSVLPSETAEGIRYVCNGAVGTGTTPSATESSGIRFSIRGNARLDWSWKTNYWFGGRLSGAFAVELNPEWREAGTDCAIPLPEGGTGFAVTSLNDVVSGEIRLDGRCFSIPVDRPRLFEIGLADCSAGCDSGSAAVGFSFDGDSDWIVAPSSGMNGSPCLSSGPIGVSSSSGAATVLVGPGLVSFDWRVSCNTRGHYGQFLVRLSG